jgi:uncharacterized protein (TIGR03118 family)
MLCIPGRGSATTIIRLGVCCAIFGFTAASHGQTFTVTNLVTNDQAAHPAQITDPFLKNAWGITRSTGSPFWVSDNGAGVTTLYNVNPNTNVTTKTVIGSPPDASGGVVIQPPGAGTPTGAVFNSAGAAAFNGDPFLFVSEDGTISGWRNALGTIAERFAVDDPANVYKGATLNTTGGHSYLLSANFHNGSIDVLKGDGLAPNLTGTFTDPNLPSGYAPFNIQTLGSRIYVSYALQDATGHDDVPGAGHGFVNAFDLQGNLLGRIGTMGSLDSPWGLAIAPSSFGSFAGDLLVGNFGDGKISAFSPDPASPAFLGQLSGAGGKPLVIDGLWGLIPGNDGNGGSSQNIYFTAGPDNEANGLFGVIIPEPTSLLILLVGIPALCSYRRERCGSCRQ